MPLIPFPSVPKLPGVPALPRSAKFPPIVRAGLGLLQGTLWRIFQVQTRWGIWDSKGKPLGDPSKFTGLIGNALEAAGLGSTLSTGSVDYSKETRVSDFPLERGGFAAYNKVETPAAPQVVLCMQGSEKNRRTFLEAIDKACKSTDLYSVVTPEVTYINYTVERYNYARHHSKGATLLIVEITLKEIREVSALYTTSNKGQVDKPKEAAATPQADNGKVQPKPREQSTLKAATDRFATQPDKVDGLSGAPKNADGTITSGTGNVYNADGTSAADGTAGTSTRASRMAEYKF